MSGTSLDGLDMVLCQLTDTNNNWSYELIKTETYPYTSKWQTQLKQSISLSGLELLKLHRTYGLWLAERVNQFIADTPHQPDLIASHGHTIFHEPDKMLNFQLGDGAVIAAKTGRTTISDFRSLDICLNGQGAPLVPIGDQLLFNDYAACINLGGFANVSCQKENKRIAWDICPVNFVINRLVQPLGQLMDESGRLGQTGVVIDALLHQLNNLEYYKQMAPKSLAQEWVDNQFTPILKQFNSHQVQDIIRTCYEHFSQLITRDINTIPRGEVLFSGGGVYNTFLMDLIKSKTKHTIHIPNNQLVEYKEALIFALLGTLRLSNQINCLSSVTGSDYNNSSGSIHWGIK